MNRRDRSRASSPATSVPGGPRLLAGLLLAVATGASAMLVAHHLGGGLPGCGPASACDSLARTFWGRVPGIGWPTAYLGLSYFASLLIAWFVSGGRLGGVLRPLAGLGGLISLLLLVVMVTEQKLCPYCLVAHIANLGFLGVALVGGRRGQGRLDRGASGGPRGTLAFAAIFAALTAILAVAEVRTKDAREAAAEADRAESVARMTQAARSDAEAASREGVPASLDPAERWGDLGFRGRYLYGPEEAPIRIVMLTDYQCPDCKQVESQLRAVLETRDDIQLSIKHFPMCREAGGGELCNRHLDRTLHRNACWAARAAEAAGMVGGGDAFVAMHFWLFDQEGNFTRAELEAEVATLGLDSGKFFAAMEGSESLRRVRADIEDGYDLGLYFTPMVFVNGVELKGWQAPTALRRTIEEVAAANPPARKAGSDIPAFAQDKYVSDWQDSPRQNLPPDRVPHYFGNTQARPGDPLVDIVVWGDYQEQNSAMVDGAIRAYLAGRSDLRYHFRHYPVDPACNKTLPPNVPETSIHLRACWAAQAAEAAGKVGGEESFLRAHEWLMENWDRLDSATLEDVARATELRLNLLEAAVADAEVQNSIDEDARAANSLGVRSIPLVYVDGKRVPRVRRGEEPVIDWILEKATSGGR